MHQLKTDCQSGSKKQGPSICCLQEAHFKYKDTCRLKVNGWRKIYHGNTNEKKARIVILMSDKEDFKVRKFHRSKEVHYIMMKQSFLQ